MEATIKTRYFNDNLLKSRYLPNSEYTYYGRIALLWINTVLVVLPILDINLIKQLKLLSNWGINMTELSIIFSIWAMDYNMEDEESTEFLLDYKPLAIWMMSATRFLTFIASTIFLILPGTFNKIGWSTPEKIYKRLNRFV